LGRPCAPGSVASEKPRATDLAGTGHYGHEEAEEEAEWRDHRCGQDRARGSRRPDEAFEERQRNEVVEQDHDRPPKAPASARLRHPSSDPLAMLPIPDDREDIDQQEFNRRLCELVKEQ
jgi:hypothetical protein